MTGRPLCHWCNREIPSDELIIALVSRSHEGGPPQEARLEEQPWHRTCFEFIQGAPD